MQRADDICGGRSLIRLHMTKEGGRGRVPSKALRPADWQDTEIVDLLGSWVLYILPRDEIDLNQDLLKFIKKLLHVLGVLKQIPFLSVRIGYNMLEKQTVCKS